MRMKLFVVTALVVMIGMLFGPITPAYAAPFIGQEHCEGLGGTWLGPDGIGGKCIGGIIGGLYSNNCAVVIAYTDSSTTWDPCPLHLNRLTLHDEDESGDFDYKDWTVKYGDGTCAEKCSANHKLPQSAQESLPGGASSWIYIQAGGSYDVCYPGIGAIYQYVSGAWAPANYQQYGDKTCVNGNSGDGSFAFLP